MPLVSLADVRAAHERVKSRVHRTALVRSHQLGAMVGMEVYLKLEAMQKTGSFKVRGAINRIAELTDEERKRGVIALSAGNHAQGVAYAAASAGVASTFVMPANAVKGKVAATKAYGGEVVQTDGDLMSVVRQIQAERGLTLIHPFDDPHVIAGAGTVANEILDELPDADAILFGIGGGGLASGTAVTARARRPEARLIGIEPNTACAMRQSLDTGKAVYLSPPPPTNIVDALAAPFAGTLNYEHVRDLGVEVCVMPEPQIVEAMWLIIERAKVLAEPAAGAGFAALLQKVMKPAVPERAKVVCIISGGNVDRERLRTLA